MKKNLLTSLAGISLTLLIGIAANGQLASSNVPSPKEIVSVQNSASNSASNSVEPSNVNQKAVKDLAKSFKNLFDEKWLKVAGGFVVKFALTDVLCQVAYDKRGNRVYSVRTYSEAKLPVDIRHIVKSTYYDYNITLVQEIEQPANHITYIIHLEGKTELINLKVIDGEMEEWQKFIRSE